VDESITGEGVHGRRHLPRGRFVVTLGSQYELERVHGWVTGNREVERVGEIGGKEGSDRALWKDRSIRVADTCT